MSESAMAATPIGTVLLIEDESVDRMLYERVIKRSGLVRRVVPFTYADEALEWLKRDDREPIDVILLDINLPRMDGFEFLERVTEELGEAFESIVVIMLTTSVHQDDYRRVADFPSVRLYLNKPLTEDRLNQVVSVLPTREATCTHR